jgi:hypothetical protein
MLYASRVFDLTFLEDGGVGPMAVSVRVLTDIAAPGTVIELLSVS